MADDAKMNGEFSEDRQVNVTGDEVSEYELKIAELADGMSSLEKEKNQVVLENKTLNDRIRKMKESIESLSSENEGLIESLRAENEGLKGEVKKLGAENRGIQAVAARAAELEGDMSRMQHDLITALSDLQEANGEIAGLKSKLESLEGGEMEKSTMLEAVVSERDLLLSKVANLEAKVGEEETEIRVLEGRVEELKVDARAREGFEKKLRDMEEKLVEKDTLIRGLAFDGEVVANGKKGDMMVEDSGKEKGKLSVGWKSMPVLAAVSTVSTVAVMGTVCYLHAKRK